ncbi:MAG: Kae1-associated serine/threonine protein kinase [Nanoarchaeales archaeon]|nr:Kae1-associated serine/threonine protein kinase [Nanoarchaeales archaeon]
MDTLIATGAESQIHKINQTTLKKIRLPKTYRLKEIDEKLRKFRNRREFKVLQKLHIANTINVPEPYKLIEDKRSPIKSIDLMDTKNATRIFEYVEISFEFEFLQGDVLKKCLTKELLFEAFEQIIQMHKLEVTHSDLTTLNMIYSNNKVFLIDFGLAEFSVKPEDRAVDLNLFFNCIKNEHPDLIKYKEELIEIYKQFEPKVLINLKKLELRGRNKQKQ